MTKPFLPKRWCSFCCGNAKAESLWSRLKTEVPKLLEWTVFTDLADVPAIVAEYFNYCNYDRLHSSIDYQMPYHTHHQTLQTTA